FAVLDTPNYSWRLGQSGNVYKVYDPQGPHLSTNIDPSSTFLENSASNGVIESVAPGPLTIDGATGEILNGVGLSRGLTVGDLVGSLGDLISTDSPVGLAVLTASALAPFVLDIYDEYTNTSPNTSGESFGCQSGGGYYYYVVTSCSTYAGGASVGPFPAQGGGFGGCTSGVSAWDQWFFASYNTGPFSNECSSSGAYSPSSTPPPANLPQWVLDNWASDSLSNDAITVLGSSTVDDLGLARSLGKRNAPLSTPVPYGYNIPSPDATVTGSPTTTTSTDPSTGNTTKTITTPSYKFSTPTPPNGVQVQKSITTVTQTCTSSGSCTTTNTTTQTAAAPQPKLGSFTSPAVSAPTTSVVAPTPFALNLAMPSQSNAVCPPPLSYNAFGTAFSIPLSPLCTLATDVRPYVESLGAVGAGLVIFR
ncbi:hypothetical protein HF285_07050, partial [Acidithiobacillus ferrooxidans F221]|uniref:virulence factor TspB C-terminal domain-related protein n=1 Tax=Acidithiobacillus ferrooxidans TaxID=920 RepID=UPI001C070A0A